MLQTKMAPSSPVLRPYVWAYGMTTGRVGSVPLVIPLPARPKQLLTFSFADPYCVHRPGADHSDASPRVTVVGPQTRSRTPLSVFGRIDNFTIHFQPSGLNRLFGIPMTELTDAAYDAHAVIGPEIPSLEHELGDIPGFAERIQLIEKRLIRLLGGDDGLDPVAIAANRLFASNGIHRVAAMATASELSPRQFERRFLAQVGVPPKLYARIIRFNAALDHKLRYPSRAWSCIANDQNYYDQMHLVHDCRAFTGESPSRFLAQLEGLPAFHTFFATQNRARDTGSDSLPDVASLLSGHAGIHYHP
jgi:AraC-like DNA-binding protein